MRTYSQEEGDAAKSQDDAARADWVNSPQGQVLTNLAKDHPEVGHVKAQGYINPGSANYGGFKGGVDYYANEASNGMASNDQAQKNNRDAMQGSFAGTMQNRGQVVGEDPRLSGNASGTRAQQLGALNLSRIAAEGGAPSEAAYQTRQGMNDLSGQMSGTMGAARGLSGLGAAQTMGGQALGSSAGGLAAAGGLARSKEIGDAVGMYGTQAGTVRDQDLSRLGMNSQNSMFNAKLNDDWKTGNAGLLASQAGLANQQSATDQGWMAEKYHGADKQFQYDQQMAAAEAGQHADEAGAAIAREQESRDHSRQMVNGGVTAGLTAVGTAFGGPAGAAAGAAAGGGFASATKDWDW